VGIRTALTVFEELLAALSKIKPTPFDYSNDLILEAQPLRRKRLNM
jgi:hypothetical protein